MNEWTDYFFPQKLLSLVILTLLVVVWNRKNRNKTGFSLLSGGIIVLAGTMAIWFYPMGILACDVCEATYWIPYLALPFIVFCHRSWPRSANPQNPKSNNSSVKTHPLPLSHSAP